MRASFSWKATRKLMRMSTQNRTCRIRNMTDASIFGELQKQSAQCQGKPQNVSNMLWNAHYC